MLIFKCKMCGGTLEIQKNESVSVCEYCGTRQTLPHLDKDKKVNLYDRANHFRRNNDFDKAMSIYEKILNEDSTDAEAYWSIVLCRYGIEYVEDTTSHKHVPTVNRVQFTSIFADEDYKSALQYADAYQKVIYEEEAKAIDDIQKGILEISNKEEPFDVFICYKETDSNGRRTQDSVLANDLYHQLVQEGFKVFFSRITLEDKLGIEYEPYIFAALNSAKVMVVLGTKPEYFNAVWVRNEWSRYLMLIKNGSKKMLIPAYRDMDPYDLPEEFSHLQAQDMSKLGFMQDLIRGIKKIVSVEIPKATVKEAGIANGGNGNIDPLLKRAFMFLEDGNWKSADEYCEKVLDQDPENAQAYLGKLMAELHVYRQDELMYCKEPFDNRNNFKKIIRFADANLVDALKGDIFYINNRNENERLEKIYNIAIKTMQEADTEETYNVAAAAFNAAIGFKDADVLAEQCLDKAEICRKDAVYKYAKENMTGEEVTGYEVAIKSLQTISGWKNADELVCSCQRKIEEIKIKKEEERIAFEKAVKKRRRVLGIITLIAVICIVFFIIYKTVIMPANKYNNALELYNSGKYDEAYDVFSAIRYKDSEEKASECFFKASECSFKESLKNVTKGGTIKFGFYEQDNDTSNGAEEIEWLVLAVEGNRALLISKYALDYQPYNTSYTSVTWENCTLRNWLNDTFLNNAFDEQYQGGIETTSVLENINRDYNSDPGNITQDKIFILSISESEEYFMSNEERKCQETAYCYERGAYSVIVSNACRWWLRSPGNHNLNAAYVNSHGSIQNKGDRISASDIYAVRPAMWINLDFYSR